MVKRTLLMAMYVTAVAALGIAAHLPWLTAFLWLLAAIPALLPKMGLTWRLIDEAILLGLALLIFGTPWAVILQVMMGAAALTISVRKEPSAERGLVGSLLIATVASFIEPLATLAFIPLIAVGVLALIYSENISQENQYRQIRLGVELALITALVSVAATLIIRFLPWEKGIAIVFTALAYPFFALVGRLKGQNFKAGGSTLRGIRRPLGRTLTGHPSHLPVILTIILLTIAAIILIIIIKAGFHYLKDAEGIGGESTLEVGIVRESLTEPSSPLFRPLHSSLSPVRHFVYRHLHHAKKRGHMRKPAETLQEWLARESSGDVTKATRIYESIRYGDMPDTRIKQREIQKVWPKE